MDGFGATYRQKMAELGGDIRVDSAQIITDPDSVMAQIRSVPEVAAAAPYGQGFMMIERGTRPAFPIVRGVDPKLEGAVVPMAKFMKVGRLEDLDDESVLLSSVLAQELGATVGSQVDLYTPMMISRLTKEELLLPKTLTVAGLYETGWHDFDQNTMVTSLGSFQDLYGLGDGVHGFTVRLKKGADLAQAKSAIIAAVGSNLRVASWKELYKDFLWVLDLERNMMFFLMLFIVVVAAFAMGSSQLMTVLRKTREIGLLMAMGATSGAVAGIYALQGFIIGVIGTVAGNAAALLILAFRNPILHAIAGWTGTADTLVEFLPVLRIADELFDFDGGRGAVAAIILATLSGMVPAMVVGRIKPAQTLRNE
jgi:lipoprotein-releasing system permease protein